MDDRKYRQAGYRGSSGQGPGKRGEPRPSGPPGPLKTRAVSRCVDCGWALPIAVDVAGRCPNCGIALHACQQCAHFDPSRRFECTEPVSARVADKRAGNECASYALRVAVERETTSAPIRPGDVRRGFDNLFKKP